MLSLTLMSLATCSGTSASSDGCEWSRSVVVSPQDVLTPDTARQIDKINKTFVRVCGGR